MSISYRDWRDLHDKIDRLERLIRTLIDNVDSNNAKAVLDLTAEVTAHTAALDAAIPKP